MFQFFLLSGVVHPLLLACMSETWDSPYDPESTNYIGPRDPTGTGESFEVVVDYGPRGPIPDDAPTDFVVNADGTVLHSTTGLIWQDLNLPSGSWQAAYNYCESLEAEESSDWRLPEMWELKYIVSYSPAAEAGLDQNFFSGVEQGYYWTANSSFTHIEETTYWSVYFVSGGGIWDSPFQSQYEGQRVRCVAQPIVEPTPRIFTVNIDGTVSDSATGLQWQREDDGQYRIWQHAVDYCKLQSLAGYSDWRLPTVKELDSLVKLHKSDHEWSDLAIDTNVFSGSNVGSYWSSTVVLDWVGGERRAMTIEFGEGRWSDYAKIDTDTEYQDNNYVRCVRDQN